MRLRILSSPPLPPLKAWFADDSLRPSDTIFTLKTALCTSMRALQQAKVRADNVCLTLDNFELLDEISISVVRDGELLTLEASPDTRCTTGGRQEDSSLSLKTRRTSASTRDSEASPSSDSNSVASHSLPSPLSDTTSSPNAPSVLKFLESTMRPVVQMTASPLPTLFVPPGRGKQATRRRNLRRRLGKRQAIKSTSFGPFSFKSTAAERIIDSPSLRRHKPKTNIDASIPGKIVFSDNFEHVSPQNTLVDQTSSNDIPAPSVRQKQGTLPRNMFITSIDVEDKVAMNLRQKAHSLIIMEDGRYTLTWDDKTSSKQNMPLELFVPCLNMWIKS